MRFLEGLVVVLLRFSISICLCGGVRRCASRLSFMRNANLALFAYGSVLGTSLWGRTFCDPRSAAASAIGEIKQLT